MYLVNVKTYLTQIAAVNEVSSLNNMITEQLYKKATKSLVHCSLCKLNKTREGSEQGRFTYFIANIPHLFSSKVIYFKCKVMTSDLGSQVRAKIITELDVIFTEI